MSDNNTVYPITFDATFGDGQPPSNATDPVETLVEILEGAIDYGLYGDYGANYGSDYNTKEPGVHKKWETTPQGRESNPRPSFYVWSPSDTSFEEFSADGDRLNADRTVEVEIWTLQSELTEQYHQDVVDILDGYMRDNYRNTEWHQIKPAGATDLRAEKIVQKTDHYIMTVQVDASSLRNV